MEHPASLGSIPHLFGIVNVEVDVLGLTGAADVPHVADLEVGHHPLPGWITEIDDAGFTAFGSELGNLNI